MPNNVPTYEETAPLSSDVPTYEESRPIQKLNRTKAKEKLAAMPQFQPEEVPALTKIGAAAYPMVEPLTPHGILSAPNRAMGLPDPDTTVSLLDPYLDAPPDRTSLAPNTIRPSFNKMMARPDAHPSLVEGVQESMREGVRSLTTPETLLQLPGYIASAPIRVVALLNQLYHLGGDIATTPERYRELGSQPGATLGDLSKQLTTDAGHVAMAAGFAKSLAPEVPPPMGTGPRPAFPPTPPTLELPPAPVPKLLGEGLPLRMADAPTAARPPLQKVAEYEFPTYEETAPVEPTLVMPDFNKLMEDKPQLPPQLPSGSNPLKFSKQEYNPPVEEPIGKPPKRELFEPLPANELLHAGVDMDAIKEKLKGALGRAMFNLSQAQQKETQSEFKPGRLAEDLGEEIVDELFRKGKRPSNDGLQAIAVASTLFERGHESAFDLFEPALGSEFLDELKTRGRANRNIYEEKHQEIKDVTDAANKKAIFKLQERAALDRQEFNSGAPIDKETLQKLGVPNATRELRTGDIPEGKPPGNLPKVGEEIRPGAKAPRSAREEENKAQIEFLNAGASIGESFKKLLSGLNADRKSIMLSMRPDTRKLVDMISAKRDAVDNAPLLTQERAESRINLTANRIFGEDIAPNAKAAAVVVQEARGNRAMLPVFEAQARKVGWEEGVRAVQFAEANWDRLKPLVADAEAIDTMNLTSAVFHGLKLRDRDAYRMESYDNPQRGLILKEPVDPMVGRVGSYPNMFDAAEHGVKTESLDLAGLVGKRTNALQHDINLHLWTEGLKHTMFQGSPVVVDIPPGSGNKAPPGYKLVQTAPGRFVAVHRTFAPLIHALTEESVIANSKLGRAALYTVGTIKHGTLAIDTFHLSRIFQFYQSLGPGGNLNLVKPILEFSKGDLNEALRQGKITQDQFDYANEKITIPQGTFSRYDVNSIGTKVGTNLGKHSEALYSDFIRSFPFFKQTFGAFNRLVFDTVSRRALAQAFQVEFERIANNNPSWTVEQVGRAVARDLNFRFGNIGRQGIFKSRSMQDLMQLAFMAPRWVESMAQSEVRSAGQLVKSAVPGEDFGKVPTMLKGTATLLMAHFAVAQALNMWSTGQPTWKNEKGHELDVWIPPVTKGGKGFWLSSLAVGAEITHDAIRYARQDKNAVEVGRTILENKLSNMGRAVDVLLTGGPMNRGKTDPIGAATELVNPSPLFARQTAKAIKAGDPTPAVRQAFSMVGLKAEPESAEETIAREVEGMNLKQRKTYEVERKAKLHEKDATMSDDERRTSQLHGAERSRENIAKRGSELTEALSKADRQWIQSRHLLVPGMDNKIGIHGEKVVLSKKETDRLAELTQQQLEKFAMPMLRKRYDNIPEQGRAEFFSDVMAGAREKARRQLMQEIESKAKVPGRKRQSAFEP